MRNEPFRLKGRYDDDRYISVQPSLNYEVAIKIGNQTPIFVDAIDILLLIVSNIVLNEIISSRDALRQS